MHFTRLISLVSALLGFFVPLQLVLTLWSWQPEWFAQPQAVFFAALWLVAGLAGLSAAFRPPRGVPAATWERLPWLGAGALLGFVVPGLFSVAPYLFLAATLFAVAAAMRAPRKRYALEALGLAVAVTLIALGISALGL